MKLGQRVAIGVLSVTFLSCLFILLTYTDTTAPVADTSHHMLGGRFFKRGPLSRRYHEGSHGKGNVSIQHFGAS